MRLPAFIADLVFLPTLWWNLLHARVLKKWHWWDRVDDHVIIGALPFRSLVPELKAAGVKAVVNMCREYPGPLDAYQAAGIEQLHVPTVDFSPPSIEDVERAVEFIKLHVDAGQTVYVHCKAGRGRSATVVLCWLIAHNDVSPEAAQSLLNDRRKQVLPTVYQRQVVQEFYRCRRNVT
ncbi:MAG: phosphatidylglycerophosphatase and protein-tyrosine phosphatase 1 family protein [Pirellulaceae bacterium]|nr:dual specificity protein phosphatase family protein [Planctomycetales bacterium]